MTVHYDDGTSEDFFRERATGSPLHPFTPELHQAKLDELIEEMIGKSQADELFAIIDRLAPDTPIRDLTALLCKPTEASN